MTAETAVRERPILFSGPMIRAILDGRKSMTRRVIKNLNPTFVASNPEPHHIANAVPCPYGAPGDRLWCKEHWYPAFARTATNSGVMFPSLGNPHGAPLGHPNEANPGWSPNGNGKGWKNPRFMPKYAARIWLEITEVRVQRVQEISEEDAIAEGSVPDPDLDVAPGVSDGFEHRMAFARLWDTLNAKRPGCSWAESPWVWAISFRKLESK